MPQAFAEQFRSISMSSNLGASLERAHGFSRAQAHRSVLLEHLLLALIEDPDASGVLRASNVDAVRLGTDVSDYLGRLMEDMRAEPGTEPRPDAELLRVLHAAGQAAQQSRRRQIDGAIVLAAVVGDGKSPAAGMLKTLGLGFDEAIRALQKASAQARSKQFASPPPAALRRAAATSETPAAPSIPAPTPAPPSEPPADEAPPPEAPQTVEEILAAARARIQRRTAAIVGRPEPAKAPPATAPAPAPTPFSSGLVPPADLPDADPPAAQEPETDGIDDVTEPATPAPPAHADAGPPLPTPPQPTWTLPGPLPNPAARLPLPGSGHGPAPFPARVQARDGVSRPPLPGRAGPLPAPLPGLPNRLPTAPWPDATEPMAPIRQPTNGAASAVQSARPAGQRQGQRPGTGPLVETIPRRMRVGAPAPAQVRVSRDKIDGLIMLLLGQRGGPMRPDAFLMRALTVRLVAPDGGFWIETGSQETQWFEATASGVQQDDYATWRWTVVPQRRGRHRLLLVVSARTVGRDGLAAETSPPDRVIEVTVKGGAGQRLLRWMRVLALLVAGALIGRFGSEFWAMGATALRRLLG
jgi:hypothetical protein